MLNITSIFIVHLSKADTLAIFKFFQIVFYFCDLAFELVSGKVGNEMGEIEYLDHALLNDFVKIFFKSGVVNNQSPILVEKRIATFFN